MTGAETHGFCRKGHNAPQILTNTFHPRPGRPYARILTTLGSHLNYWCTFELRRVPQITVPYLKCVLSSKHTRNCSITSLQ